MECNEKDEGEEHYSAHHAVFAVAKTSHHGFADLIVSGKILIYDGVEFLPLFSTFFIFLRHRRAGGDPDGNRSKALTASTQVKTANLPLDPRLRGDDGETCQ